MAYGIPKGSNAESLAGREMEHEMFDMYVDTIYKHGPMELSYFFPTRRGRQQSIYTSLWFWYKTHVSSGCAMLMFMDVPQRSHK